MPSASFCLLLSVHCRKMSKIKVLGKFQKNYIKNQQYGRLQKPEGQPEGGHPPTRRPAGAAREEAAPSGRLVRWGLLSGPLWPYFYSRVFENFFFAKPFGLFLKFCHLIGVLQLFWASMACTPFIFLAQVISNPSLIMPRSCSYLFSPKPYFSFSKYSFFSQRNNPFSS